MYIIYNLISLITDLIKYLENHIYKQVAFREYTYAYVCIIQTIYIWIPVHLRNYYNAYFNVYE